MNKLFSGITALLLALPLFAQEGGGGGDGGGGGGGFGGLLSLALPFIILLAVLYFFIIMPQSRQEKKRKKMIGALQKGDRVVTSGGVIGTVSRVSEDEIALKVSENTTIKITKWSIQKHLSEELKGGGKGR